MHSLSAKVDRVRATSRAENPTKEDIMDGTVAVDAEKSKAEDAENNNTTTTPIDGGEAVDLMRAHDWTIASTNEVTARHMEAVCT